jgi:hypothetical protein
MVGHPVPGQLDTEVPPARYLGTGRIVALAIQPGDEQGRLG